MCIWIPLSIFVEAISIDRSLIYLTSVVGSIIWGLSTYCNDLHHLCFWISNLMLSTVSSAICTFLWFFHCLWPIIHNFWSLIANLMPSIIWLMAYIFLFQFLFFVMLHYLRLLYHEINNPNFICHSINQCDVAFGLMIGGVSANLGAILPFDQ